MDSLSNAVIDTTQILCAQTAQSQSKWTPLVQQCFRVLETSLAGAEPLVDERHRYNRARPEAHPLSVSVILPRLGVAFARGRPLRPDMTGRTGQYAANRLTR